MPPSTRITPLLYPCVQLPREDSILLLTSTLGASANWLIIRFLCNVLSNSGAPAARRIGGDGAGNESSSANEDAGMNVVLVSWMRDYEFWKQEARKGGGLDLEKLRREGRFAAVDGLGGLFVDQLQQPQQPQHDAKSSSMPGTAGRLPAQNSPLRAAPSPSRTGIVPARGPAPSTSTAIQSPTATTTAMRRGANATPPSRDTATATDSGNASQKPGLFTLRSADLAHIKSTIHAAIAHLEASSSSPDTRRKTLVVLDNPDILLATSDAQIAASSLTSLFLGLHAQPSVSHVAVHLQADTPLLGPGSPPQPIEVGQRNLMVKTAHMSRRVLGVRVLDTGVARDVSGVLRVTENEGGLVDLRVGGDDGRGKNSVKGQEMLYKVGGDGSVKVFERGAGGEG